ncbi:hypothetical protein F6X42_18710 [Paraburkholderia sp. WC7.3b]|uniref:Uncharacterized protein n=1 Tax=Paraburkholderia podalyriae TaxID=1938811 RepID=A0ABR7PQJ9_9BURK|nr:hypothetical protein [Paraburkholderia podalyriae]
MVAAVMSHVPGRRFRQPGDEISCVPARAERSIAAHQRHTKKQMAHVSGPFIAMRRVPGCVTAASPALATAIFIRLLLIR